MPATENNRALRVAEWLSEQGAKFVRVDVRPSGVVFVEPHGLTGLCVSFVPGRAPTIWRPTTTHRPETVPAGRLLARLGEILKETLGGAAHV